jgi:hypothetical protein
MVDPSILYFVMRGHSRSKNGVASLAYAPRIHALLAASEGVDGRDKPGRDDVVVDRKKHP